jgi:ribonuclease T2
LLKAWLMHGIWPTKTGTVGPVNCDKNATWNIDPVDPILSELKEFWPNLESDTPVDSFWQHEWLKHGTCAQSLPALVGEYNFFNIPLTLQQQSYDFYAALASFNITPDASQKFSHQQFTGALQAKYGSSVEVWCTYSKETKSHYVAEIRLCLTKSFNLMDCPQSTQLIKSVAGTDSCPQGMELVYAPIPSTPNRPPLPPVRPTRPASRL